MSQFRMKKVFGLWEFWLDEQEIANQLSIPQLWKYGYIIDYNPKLDWVGSTSEGNTMLFHKDVGMYEGIPYLDINGNHDAFVMIQTIR